MAATFGLAGCFWRRLPSAVHRLVVLVGLTVSTVAYLGLADGMRGGAHPLGWLWLAVAGVGLGLSVSPLLTQSLAHVPAARAADASGLLTTTAQLGQLMGVAIIGSVYLSHATLSHGDGSGAMSVTAYWLAALSALGLVAAALMVRAARAARSARA